MRVFTAVLWFFFEEICIYRKKKQAAEVDFPLRIIIICREIFFEFSREWHHWAPHQTEINRQAEIKKKIPSHQEESRPVFLRAVWMPLFCNYTLITAMKPEECPSSGSADVLRRVPYWLSRNRFALEQDTNVGPTIIPLYQRPPLLAFVIPLLFRISFWCEARFIHADTGSRWTSNFP